MASSAGSRPPYLIRNNRPKQNKFGDSEPLYRALHPDSIDRTDDKLYVAPDSLSFRSGWSVNRGGVDPETGSLFSKPADVLITSGRPGWAVVGFSVADMPRKAHTPLGKNAATYSLRLEHEPEKTNYAHSEIQTMKNGAYHPKTNISKHVRNHFAALVCKGMHVIIDPSASNET